MYADQSAQGVPCHAKDTPSYIVLIKWSFNFTFGFKMVMFLVKVTLINCFYFYLCLNELQIFWGNLDWWTIGNSHHNRTLRYMTMFLTRAQHGVISLPEPRTPKNSDSFILKPNLFLKSDYMWFDTPFPITRCPQGRNPGSCSALYCSQNFYSHACST